MSSGRQRAAPGQVGARKGRVAAGTLRSGRGGAGFPCATLGIPPLVRLLGAQRGMRNEEVIPCLPPATHGSGFPCRGPKSNPVAAMRVHRQPHGWVTAQVAAMLMALLTQVVALEATTLAAHSPYFSQSEVSSSPAAPAQAGTQVRHHSTVLQPGPCASCQHLLCPSGWSKMQRRGLQEIMHISPKPNEKSCNLLRFPLSQSSLAGNPASTSASAGSTVRRGGPGSSCQPPDDEKHHKFWWEWGHAQRRSTFGVSLPAAPINK